MERNETKIMSNLFTIKSEIATTPDDDDEQCLPSGLKELCIALALICILLAATLAGLCFFIMVRYRRKAYGGRKKRTQEFLERKYGDFFYPILFNPDKEGKFKKRLDCPICKKKSTGNFDMCIHFKRMIKFRVFEENNRIARELIYSRREPKKLSAGSQDAANTTMDLNDLMKQYPFITSSCSMLYSAYSYHSSEDISFMNQSIGLTSHRSIDSHLNKSMASRRSFIDLFQPLKNAAKKFSFTNLTRSRSFLKSSTPVPDHESSMQILEGDRHHSSMQILSDDDQQDGSMQILEVGHDLPSWTATPKSAEIRRWSAQSFSSNNNTLSPNENKSLPITSYSNPAIPVDVCWPVGCSSWKRKRDLGITRAMVHENPKIVVHPSYVPAVPVGTKNLNKQQSVSLQHLKVSQCTELLPARHSVSSFEDSNQHNTLHSSSFLDVPKFA